MRSFDNSTSRCQSFVLPIVAALVITSVFAGCDGDTDPTGPGPDGQEYIETRVVTVGPTLAKCYGVGLRTCMVVDGGFFYDAIEGFEYETGYTYRLRIGKYDPWGGREPPQDASLYAYRLAGAAGEEPGAFHGGHPDSRSRARPMRSKRRLLSGGERRAV